MLRQILVSAVLVIVLSSCSRAQSSKDVMTTVLDHFARRMDTSSLDESGVILIDRTVPAWGEPEFTGLAPMDDQPACQADQALYDAFVASNSKERMAAEFLGESEMWRLADQQEVDQMPLLVRASDGKPIKTVVRLYAPAFSEDGKQAFVLLAFTWSIHGAWAGYVVEKAEGHWKVKCSLLNFLV